MATATGLDRGDLTTLFVHAVEKRSKKVIDISRKEMKLMNLFKQMGIWKLTDAPFAQIDPFIDTKDVPVTTFKTGLENLPTTLVQGAHAKYVEFANMAAPVGMTWVEEQKIKDPYKIIDLAETRTYKAGVAIGERLEREAVIGTLNDADTIKGLEQIFVATDPVDTGLASVNSFAELMAAQRWQLRQTNDTYFGIDRSPFTADDVGGSHMENVAINMDVSEVGITAGHETFTLVSGVASESLRILNKAYDSVTYGGDGPDILYSTYKPFQDYCTVYPQLIQYTPTGANQGAGINLGVGLARFRNAWWAASEQAVSSGAGDAEAGDDMIYGWDSKWHHFYITNGGNFQTTPFRHAGHNLAAIAQLLLRGQQVNDNPRTGFVLFSYGRA